MTHFDEAKHARHSDGKFANKPHAEANLGAPLAATQTLMAAHRTVIDLERDRLEEEAAENGVELPDELELSPETKRSMDVAFRNWHTANKDNLTDLTPQELEPHNLGALS